MTVPAEPVMHGPDTECPACYECPGCNGGDGSTPKVIRLVERPGLIMGICEECGGDAILCPWYDPALGDERDSV